MALQYLAEDLKLFVKGTGRSICRFSPSLIRGDRIGTDVAEQARPQRWSQMTSDSYLFPRDADPLPLVLALGSFAANASKITTILNPEEPSWVAR